MAVKLVHLHISVAIKAFVKPSSLEGCICDSGIKPLAVFAQDIFGE